MRILFLFIFILFSLNVNAQHFGNADRYDVTIKQIDVCENATITNENNFTTSGCVTLGSSDFTVDIASKAVGATFGKYTDTTGMIQGELIDILFQHIKIFYNYWKCNFHKTVRRSSSAVCNTDEDASIASNARHLTISAGKVGGTATPMTGYVYLLQPQAVFSVETKIVLIQQEAELLFLIYQIQSPYMEVLLKSQQIALEQCK